MIDKKSLVTQDNKNAIFVISLVILNFDNTLHLAL